ASSPTAPTAGSRRSPRTCGPTATCSRPRSMCSGWTRSSCARRSPSACRTWGRLPANWSNRCCPPIRPWSRCAWPQPGCRRGRGTRSRAGAASDRRGTQALLLVETRAAGFDPDGKREAVEAIQAAHAGARGDDPGTLELSGPGAFADEIGSRTAREAGWIGAVDSIGLVLLLLVAYRSWKIPLLGALPLASAGIAGLATLVLLFGDRVHGITIAFGFTLIGVVQDYPIHFFSQQ